MAAAGAVSARLDAERGGTVVSPSGIELTVPAHVLTRNANATITPLSGGVVDVHLDAPWSGRVRVGLPVSGAGEGALMAHYRDGAWHVEDAAVADGRLTASVDSLSPFKMVKCLFGGEEGITKCLLKQGIKMIPSSLAKKIGLDVTNTCGDVLDLSSWLGGGACSAGDPPGWKAHTPSATPNTAGGGDSGSSGDGTGASGGRAAPEYGSVALERGPRKDSGYRYTLTFSGWAPGTALQVECFDSASPSGFYGFTLIADASGAATTSQCYSSDGSDHWATANGVASNHVSWTAVAAPPASTVHGEQEGSHGVNTFTNYHNASGMGPRIAAGQWVDVTCKVYDPTIPSVTPGGYWYRITSSPWSGAYYSPANTFMNGDSWGGPYTHDTDFAVPDC
ncbi:hypothetical protein ACIRVK_43545 [Streptomyces sp. NPDC101152]|uniref:hypothetical protein n=1 Tax=Streptomyces sp. NPDC101152 TaxID=3366116 RepID=UPI003806365F